MTTKIYRKRLEKVDEIALHHGFVFSKTPITSTKQSPFLSTKEKNVIIKNFKPNIKSTNPILIYHNQPVLFNKKQIINPRKHKIINFDIIGIPESIAEAMIINTSFKVLAEEGYENNLVEINCTGDRESIARFKEELLDYYRKNSISINHECRKILTKKNIVVLKCNHKGCQSIQKNAPRPINFLSEQSQKHFKEVLEYLEEMNIPYRINNQLTSEDNHYSKIIFEIKNETDHEEILLARGGRYDEAANRITRKRNLLAVGVSMQFKKEKVIKAYSNRIHKPKIFLVQSGFKAKLKSFEVIDILRQQKITIYQNLHKNKLSEQFEVAKKMKVPYVITIGFKEALDNEIIFKNNLNASTHVVKIKKLPQFLRKIKLI